MEPEVIGRCPLCKDKVIEGKYSYGCVQYGTKACKFNIKKVLYGKKITKSMVSKLLMFGRTNVMKGFKTKDGDEYQASLVLDLKQANFMHTENFKITKMKVKGNKNHNIPEDKIVGDCPLCGEPIIEHSKGFSCSSWKVTQCSFYISNNIKGNTITRDMVKEILENGQTEWLENYRNPDESIGAYIIMSKDDKKKKVILTFKTTN